MFRVNKKRSTFGVFLLVVVILSLVLSTTSLGFAQEGPKPVDTGASIQGEANYEPTDDKVAPAPAISLQSEQFNQRAAQGVDVSELRAVSVIVTFDESVDAQQLEAVSGGQVVHSFSKVFNGASLVLAGDKIDAIANLTGVTGIYLDELQQLDTETSPQFIGAPTMWNSLGGQESAGEGVIVGILDSGIWPEHPSVSDPDPFGNAFPAPPTIPGSNGFYNGIVRDTCDFGNTAYNPDDAPFTCNNKLIGAYDFLDTYNAVVGLIPTEFDSARDSNGHGTHTMTTSAGNGGVEATLLGVPRGTISGIAPRAHVISYKVCGLEGCYSSDSMAAVEQAILDDVDVINFSISGGENPFSDVVELAFSRAYESGMFIAASAGNAGPGPDTVAHRGPWTMTVGASTSDRHFLSTVTLEADNGDTLELVGATVTSGISTPTDVVYPPFDPLCLNPYPAGTFSGEIVICERGAITRVAKSFNVAEGGAGGMLLYNPVNQGLATDNHFIPSVHLEGDDGVTLNAFMGAHTGVTGTFTDGLATAVPGDWMAAFSSRGGPGQSLGVSKPDITAPGVQILAGHTPLPENVDGGLPGELFQSIQGTSMSSPHIAGSAALVAALHPDWTPGQIKSALMTTANANHMKEDGVTPADAFDYGSGRVDLAKAGNPGLTISATTQEFMDHEADLWNANYPSLYVPVMPGRITVERTVHSELSRTSVWRATVDSPDDVTVLVQPILVVRRGGDKTFNITIDARNVPLGEVRHATLTLTRLGHYDMDLRFPISFVRNQPVVTLDKTCDPAVIARRGTTDCTITMTNTGFDAASVNQYDFLPRELRLVNGSVIGGNQHGSRLITFDGSLFGAGPPVLDVVSDPFGGYLPLSLFFAPTSCPSNCDDGGYVISGLDINYLGQNYTSAIWSINGTLELGTASGVTSSFANQNLPDTAIPNNVLAPWWTDLNLGDGGNWYFGALTDGVSTWDIFEWENVPRWGDGSSTFTFQIWLERGTENIHFTYGPYSGDTLNGTTGAEDETGTIGDAHYFNGVGTLPWASQDDLSVASIPGTPGETHTITFTAKGQRTGDWQNCAQMTGDTFFGTNIACFSGEVTR